MRIYLTILLTISSLYSGHPDLVIKKGQEYEVCRDYANYFNHRQYFWPKFRYFDEAMAKKYTRLKWEPISFDKANLTLLKRASTFVTEGSGLDGQYKRDHISNEKFVSYFPHNDHPWFYHTKLDIDFDGKKEDLIRVWKDSSPDSSHSKLFTIAIVVVHENNSTVDEIKSQLTREPFRDETMYERNRTPYHNMRTDSNIFLHKNKIYIDTVWDRMLIARDLEPLFEIVELTKEGVKKRCLFDFTREKK